MFRKTSKQLSLDSVENTMDISKLKKLKKTWAQPFRDKILPLIDEEIFKDLFHAHIGAPNKSIRTMVGLLLLKEQYDMTDNEIIENFEFNAQWHYAFDVSPSEADICRKTVHTFRTKLIESKLDKNIFNSITDGIAQAAKIDFSHQRTDSTHIISNMKQLQRLGLFVKTIESFLKRLKKKAPSRIDRLPKRFHERYLDREGYFADSKSSKSKRRIEASAKDVWYLLDAYREIKEITRLKEYKRLERLFSEQCKMADGDGQSEELVELKVPKSKKAEDKIPTNSLQSPFDEDATYGHKGKGYELQLSETCSDDNAFQLITDVEVTDSCGSDHNEVSPTINRLDDSGKLPERLYADSGYINTANIELAEEQGVELYGPLSGPIGNEEHLHLEDFELDELGNVLACPAGHAPIETKKRKDKAGFVTDTFDRTHCECCEHADSCPVFRDERYRERKHPTRKRGGRKNQKLRTTKRNRKIALQRKKQKTKNFKQAYKIRSGIEATNSELKRCHGLNDIKIRGKTKVRFVSYLKATALNMKRFAKALVRGFELPLVAKNY